mmetsp:Transcript_17743/g.49172  ORF Transcript_17743/g.49172 Transcript_17743/m.49172 type:complete len:253 (-) Transcript_17743:721-1479(-)
MCRPGACEWRRGCCVEPGPEREHPRPERPDEGAQRRLRGEQDRQRHGRGERGDLRGYHHDHRPRGGLVRRGLGCFLHVFAPAGRRVPERRPLCHHRLGLFGDRAQARPARSRCAVGAERACEVHCGAGRRAHRGGDEALEGAHAETFHVQPEGRQVGFHQRPWRELGLREAQPSRFQHLELCLRRPADLYLQGRYPGQDQRRRLPVPRPLCRAAHRRSGLRAQPDVLRADLQRRSALLHSRQLLARYRPGAP